MHLVLSALRKLTFFLDITHPHPDLNGWEYIGAFGGVKPEDLPLMKTVAKDLDGYLPFNRRAPSVTHAMSPSGLAHRSLDRSTLWSAVCFRGVSFKSRYHFDHDTYMQDFDEYKNRVLARPDKPSVILNPMVKTDHYWANPNMYSKGPHSPSVTSVEAYWKSVNKVEYYPPHKTFRCYSRKNLPPSSLPSPLPFMPFLKDYLLFKRTVKREKINLFPGLGNLSAYLCALDLSYVGLVERPTLDDIVMAMVDIDSGGIRGLVELGLVEKRDKGKYPFKDIRLAFQAWHDFLDEHLDEEEKEKMKFSVDMCEHTDCKISKLVKAGVLDLADDCICVDCEHCIRLYA